MPNIAPVFHAFTTQNSVLINRLVNDATAIYVGNSLMVKALWDTGATGTCISTEVVRKLSMISTGKKNINTPAGTKQVNTYLIDIILPNHVIIEKVEVCDTDIGNQGIDMLIGMDIILLGDFALSSYNKQTVFSFRVPSKQKTDYVQQINTENLIGQKHGKGKRKHK